MVNLLIPLAILAALAAIAGALWWLAARVRRHGGDAVGPFDELWHPAAHRTRIEVQEQAERGPVTPSPDDL